MPHVCKYTQIATRMCHLSTLGTGLATMHVYRQIGSVLALLAACGSVRAGELTVYSALESDEIAIYLAAAKKALPDIDVNVLRLSSGDLAARLLAESAEPRNDAIWGMAVTDMLDPRIAALLEPVHGSNIDRMPASFRGSDARWFAPTGYLAALCVNRDDLADVSRPDRDARSGVLRDGIHGAFVALRRRTQRGRHAPGDRHGTQCRPGNPLRIGALQAGAHR